MKQRIKHVLLRARYAAIGAAVGAAIGSVFSRNAASTGGAIGAMAGATIADTRETVTAILDEAKERDLGPLSEDADTDPN
ncbi:17 kDa surface antigen [Haloterrigena turkmenica DSM 5511]|uniref:17 kDa surface antigen n=1 Tax=Haloterrigena turkmenica (strain ATCC 51198 / DSM 5511 / JCM 9101 / NCIMB 13204 / VKM B-1734 / 4k) TaxID=543526 RepID=D2RRE7_HALTV|nr:glycine zipper 2TM domain-containing protein [Haloterrigena turkmenica]ADB60507.1 17 kDa surface antigen [Haloterrigena turkmenica DSM 5511]